MTPSQFKPRKKTCKGCGDKFIPSKPMQPTCSPRCSSATAKPKPARKPMKAASVRQTALTKAARGRDCQVRLPGCPNDTGTTVLAHYRLAGTCGTGIKPNDLQGAYADDYCHSICDSRMKAPEGLSREDVRLYHAEGVMRTIDILVKEGAVKA